MNIKERENLTKDKLKHYQDIRRRIREANEDIEAGQLGSRQGDPVQTSSHSDPTARGAERLLSLANEEEWIAAIDAAMNDLKTDNLNVWKIVRRHFRMDYAAGYNRRRNCKIRNDIMETQHISEREYYDRLDYGVRTVMVYASDRGLFK